MEKQRWEESEKIREGARRSAAIVKPEVFSIITYKPVESVSKYSALKLSTQHLFFPERQITVDICINDSTFHVFVMELVQLLMNQKRLRDWSNDRIRKYRG